MLSCTSCCLNALEAAQRCSVTREVHTDHSPGCQCSVQTKGLSLSSSVLRTVMILPHQDAVPNHDMITDSALGRSADCSFTHCCSAPKIQLMPSQASASEVFVVGRLLTMIVTSSRKEAVHTVAMESDRGEKRSKSCNCSLIEILQACD